MRAYERQEEAFRRSLDAVDYTCPTVDRAAEDLVENLVDYLGKAGETCRRDFESLVEDMVGTAKSEGTERLRAALDGAYLQVVELEEKVKELEEERDGLAARIEELEDQQTRAHAA